MKKWILRIIILCVIVALAIVGAVFYFLNDIVKKGVETVGPKVTQSEVRLARAKLSPFSGQGQLSGIFVGNPEGFKSESAIKVGDVKVAVNTSSVLKDTIVVDSIHIQAPEITFEGTLTGSNLGKLLDNVEAAARGSGGKDTPAEKSSGSTKKFKVKDVLIQGAKARVHVSVPGVAAKDLTLPIADIHLQNIGTDTEGVTAAELTRDIIKPLIVAVIKTATEAAGNLPLKDVTKGTTEQLQQKTKGITDLFQKK